MSDLGCGDCDSCLEACCQGCFHGCVEGCCSSICDLCCFGGGPVGCALITLAVLALVVFMLVMAFAVVRPVRVTVEDASLTRLALANASATALAYDAALAVAVRNPNWMMSAKHAAPLDAELLFAGQRFARVRMGSAGRRVQPGKTGVYHVVAAADSADVALGSAGLAEFVRESTAGVFQLELRFVGEIKYSLHHVRTLEASCPLELPLSSAPASAPAMFRKVKCVLA